jgi:hypothetical protein
MNRVAVSLALFVCAQQLACVPKPEKAYSPDEVGTIDSLQELMRINASKADPLFGKRDQQSFTEAEWAAMADTGVMVEATGKRTAERHGGQGNYDDGFVDYANQLATSGKALADAAGSKDPSGARQALTDMRNACKACHGVYR